MLGEMLAGVNYCLLKARNNVQTWATFYCPRADQLDFVVLILLH